MQKEEGGDAWLNTLLSMGCAFYAPLNKQGDLTDHISGAVGSSYSYYNSPLPSDNLTYSTENECYLLHAKNGGETAIEFPVSGFYNKMPNDTYTHVVTAKLGNLHKFCYTFAIGRNTGNPSSGGWSLWHWYGNDVLSDSKFITLFVVVDGTKNESKKYVNTQLYKKGTQSNTWGGFKRNWKSSWYNYISINGSFGCDAYNNSYEGQAYFKECALFNRILTPEEMQIIVNHNNN